MTPAKGGYLELLPALYASDPLLAGFLRAFEQVFTGLPDSTGEPAAGLEELIADVPSLFQAQATRDDFLPWLSGWVALGLRADWTKAQQRDFLAQIVGLYRRRGTKDNLAELLRIYTTFLPVITDGDDAPAGERAAHHFHVKIHMNPDKAVLDRTRYIASALIDMQKPAHTTYTLVFDFTTMQIGKRSRIGVDTLLGTSRT